MMEDKVRKIMLDKLEEMSGITIDDFEDDNVACYNGICSVMNEIAKTLLRQNVNNQTVIFEKK